MDNKTSDDSRELLFKVLFDSYKEKIYRIAYYILKNDQDAKDVLQDTFLTAFQKIHQLRDKEKFESWICSIACNLAKQRYNKKKKEILIDDDNKIIDFGTASIFDYNQLPEMILEKEELKLYIKEHMKNLNPHHKEILTLYYYTNLSYNEISNILKISIGTVKTRLHRAKNQFKNILIKNNFLDECSKEGADDYAKQRYSR